MVTLTTINITDAQVNVNPTLTFTCVFSHAIDSSTANVSTIILYDTLLQETVDAIITVSSNSITIKPKKILRERRVYTFTLVGKKTNSVTNARYLYNTTSNYLETTLSFTFTTGAITDAILIQETDDSPDSSGFIESALFEDLPSDLDIDYVSPSPLSYGLPRNTSLITIKFNENVYEQDSLVTVTVKPFLNDVMYMALDNDAGDGYTYRFNDRQGTSYDWTLPTAYTTWDGQYLYITLSSEDGIIDADNQMPYGTIVVVELDANISSESGNILSTDYEYEFIFEAAPAFASVDSVKFDPAFYSISNIPDKLIYKLIVKNSMELTRGRTWLNKYTYTYWAQKYVEAASMLFLMRKSILSKHFYGRVRRERLADLTIEYSDRDNLYIGDGVSYMKELQNKMDTALRLMSDHIAIVGTLRSTSAIYNYVYTRIPRQQDIEAGQDISTLDKYASETSFDNWPYKSQEDLQ